MQFNKKNLHRRLAQLQQIKTWQLVVVLVIGLVVTATFLHDNNIAMMHRRDAVMAADKKGDKEEIKKTLVDLQAYVSSHMNTSLMKGLYLEHSYERDRASAVEAAGDVSNPNATIQQQASVECQSRFQGGVASYRNDYVRCVAERMAALSPGGDPTGLHLPQAENYHYNFFSPLWSPDLAGFAVLFCLFVTSVIVLRLLSELTLRLALRARYKAP